MSPGDCSWNSCNDRSDTRRGTVIIKLRMLLRSCALNCGVAASGYSVTVRRTEEANKLTLNISDKII